jgi:transcriptional regulator with XRE-family HTH domain
MLGRRKGTRIGALRKDRADAYAEALNRLRVEKDMTLAELASAARLSLRTVKTLETRGRQRATWHTLRAINRALFGERFHQESVQALAEKIRRDRYLEAQKVHSRSSANAPIGIPRGSVDFAPLAIAKGARRGRTKARRR